MIKILNNKVELTKSCELTKKQIHKISLLPESDQLKYALSLMGLSKSKIAVNPKDQHGIDKLASKNTNSVLSKFRDLLDCSSDKLHKPLTRAIDSNWVGVEIECLIEGESESNDCDSCDGSGSRTCGNCDGSGEVTTEDSNGNEYCNTCPNCEDGSEECGECDGNSSCSSSIHAKVRRQLERAKITNCSVKSDGSLSSDEGGMVGVEVTVLLDTRHGFDKLYRVCKVLNDLGAVVNDTCGLHVHLDQFKNTTEQSLAIGRKIGKFLPILSRLVPSSRRKNSYCKLEVSGLEGCRYHAVNMTSLKKHKTIEIRLHSGTTSAKKIESWVKLLHKIVNSNVKLHESIKTFQGLIDVLKLDETLVEYFDKRFQKFNPNDETHAPSDQPDTTDDERQGIEEMTEQLQAELGEVLSQSQTEAA